MTHADNDNAALRSENARLLGVNAALRADRAHLRADFDHVKARLSIQSERVWSGDRRGLDALLWSESTAGCDRTGFMPGGVL